MTIENDATAARSALRIQERIRQETVCALLDVRTLQDRQARALLVELVGEAMGRRVVLREQATTQLQFVELFRFCAAEEGGLTGLARMLSDLEQDCPQAAVVQRLADEWAAVASVTGLPEVTDSWQFLGAALGPLQMSYAARLALVRAATDDRLPAPPPHAETPWHDFLHVAGQNAAPGGLPPWMVYLDRSTAQMDPRTATEVMARNRQWALKCELAGRLDQERARSRPAAVPARRHQEYLAIHITPDPLEDGFYTLTYAFMSDARGLDWEHGDTPVRVPAQGLQPTVSRIIRQVERVGGDRSAHLWLEFVLPFELLNLPVDWWPRDPGEVPHVPLAVDYPVVIRSLDRLQNTAWHRFWRHRWEQLAVGEHASESVYMNVARTNGDHLRGLEARLGDNEHYVALVLSEPPLPGREYGQRELQAALRSGLPVVIWHRANRSTQEFRDVLGTLLDEGLQRFPAKVAAYRRRAAIDGENGTHLGRHLAVLWDDPDRKPVLPDVR
ncbi:effector-associated domain 2-containing protein [Streptomyces sp. CA-251387]|uniref:VMAP-C domain-containing protein n=1 Tax=Streptomyces sp. CA-251387 TaxID=3240064 RepID=UPI003D8C6FBF